jgi:hypothetical protein
MSFKKGDLIKVRGTGGTLHTGIVMGTRKERAGSYAIFNVYLTKLNCIKPFLKTQMVDLK